MKIRVFLGTICAILAGVISSDARADVASLKKALSEIDVSSLNPDPAIERIVKQQYEVFPELLEIADNKSNTVEERYNALRVLGAIAYRYKTTNATTTTNLQNALPVLLKCMNDADDFLASHATQDIGVLGEFGKPAIPDLIKATKSPFQGVRACAIESLIRLGPIPLDAMPSLKSALDDQDLTVRTLAAEAITKMAASKEQEPPSSAPSTSPQTYSGLQVSGTFEMLPQYAQPMRHLQGTFIATAEGQKWKVRTQESGSIFNYVEAGATDTNEHFSYSCETNRLAGAGPELLEKVSVGTAFADRGQVPHVDHSMMLPPVWLAYCSAKYLESVNDGQLLPVFPFRLSENPKMPAEWTIAPDSGGLPSRVVWFHDGLTNAIFQVLSIKKVGDHNERFIPKTPSENPNAKRDLTLVGTYKFNATNFSSTPVIEAGCPSIPGQVEVHDRRCPELGEVKYILTTHQWPTTGEIRGKADLQKSLENQKAKNDKSLPF